MPVDTVARRGKPSLFFYVNDFLWQNFIFLFSNSPPSSAPRRDPFYSVNYLLSSLRDMLEEKIYHWFLVYYQVFVLLSGHIMNGKS